MFTSDVDFKKDLMAHKVYSSWQFIQTARNNLDFAIFSKEAVSRLFNSMSVETDIWETDLFKDLREGTTKKVTVTAENTPKYTFDVAGEKVSGYFLIDKLIKDFYQYIRNFFDSIGQIANSGLLANNGKVVDKTDFPAMVSRFGQLTYRTAFPLTAHWFEQTNVSPEYRYIDAINNRVKHTMDIANKISMGLFGSSGTAQLEAFFRNGDPHGKRDLAGQMQATLDFAESAFQDFLTAFCAEYPSETFAKDRLHTLTVHQQKMKGDEHSSFSYAYIQCNGTFTSMPDEIWVLFVNNNEDEVYARNCPFEHILVCADKERDVQGRYVAAENIGEDCMLNYRKYSKDTVKTGHICQIEEMIKPKQEYFHQNPFFRINTVSDDDKFLTRVSIPF